MYDILFYAFEQQEFFAKPKYLVIYFKKTKLFYLLYITAIS